MAKSKAMAESRPTGSVDLVDDKKKFLLYWGLPFAVLLVQGFVIEGLIAKTVLITASWTAMGAGCLANARRCGRTHCHFTGPLFLLGAAASLLHGLGFVPLSWTMINLVTGAGAVVVWVVTEKIWGRYVSRA